MLQTLPMTNHIDIPQEGKFIKLIDLAQELKMSKDKLYGYVYRHQDQIETYTLPDSGKLLHITKADADMLRAIFRNPEDFAQRVKRKPRH